MRSTQVAPEVLIGLFSELPNPATVPQGYFYFATDTIQLFMLEINPTTQVRTWALTSSAGSLPGIPFDQVAVGNAAGTGWRPGRFGREGGIEHRRHLDVGLRRHCSAFDRRQCRFERRRNVSIVSSRAVNGSRFVAIG